MWIRYWAFKTLHLKVGGILLQRDWNKVWFEVLLKRLSLSSVILFYWLTNRPCPIAQRPINPICEGQETILPRRETRKQAEWAIRLGCCVRALEEQRDSIKAVVAAVDTYSAGNAFSPAGWIETNAQKVRWQTKHASVSKKKKNQFLTVCFRCSLLCPDSTSASAGRSCAAFNTVNLMF